MPYILLNVDHETIKKVQKIAFKEETTLTAMLSNFLTSVAQQNDLKREAVIKTMERSFKKLGRDMGPRKWNRKSLYGN